MPTVSTILTRKGTEVYSVAATDSVLDAARVMNVRGIGGVVVIHEGAVVGIFTERDILRRIVTEQQDPTTTLVRSVMTSPVKSCTADTPLDQCIAVMTENRIRHLPVIDEQGLCGILTSGDILAHQVSEQEDQIQHLNSYIHDLR